MTAGTAGATLGLPGPAVSSAWPEATILTGHLVASSLTKYAQAV